ncbi:MAG: restriction endonuclease subunit S [Campylobacter sp.]|nr:restriction endonuclease subunit S [Campylobacter sp.]
MGTKSLDSNAVDFVEHGINFIGRTFENNGIQGKIKKQKFEPNAPFTITATVIGNYKYVKYQKEPYYCSQNINKLTPKPIFIKWSEKIAIFLMTNIWRFVSMYDGQQGGYKLDDIKNHKIQLPITASGEINFDFMESFIAELEAERVRELEAYLKATGLSDTTLSSDEYNAFYTWNSRIWQEFKIGDLFEKLKLGFKKSKFEKDTDVSKIKNIEFQIPLVNAKDGDNGIMYYGKKQDFDTATMTIDIVNDGAVSTGNVYPQPQETGVLYNAYLIKSKFDISKNLLFFFATTIQKSIKLKFSYELKASWERVKNENIKLPITANGEIDFDFMENFIKAIQKLIIKDLVIWSQKKIEATKQVVEF